MDKTFPHYTYYREHLPAWLVSASQAQRDQLKHCTLGAERASEALAQALAAIPDLRSFARQLLQPLLDASFGAGVNPEMVTLEHRYVKPCMPRLWYLDVTTAIYDIVNAPCPQHTTTAPLLQAALANFPGVAGFQGLQDTYHTAGDTRVDAGQFMALAHGLDLGGQYQTVLEHGVPPLGEGSPSVALAFQRWQRALLTLAATRAVLCGDMAHAALGLLGAYVDTLPVPPLGCEVSALAVLGVTLQGVRVFHGTLPDGTPAWLLYLPNGTPALKQYSSLAALHNALLSDLTYQPQRHYLMGLARLREQPVLADTLRHNMGPAASEATPPAFLDPGWAAMLRLDPLASDTAADAYTSWRQTLLDNAATLAVPAAQVREREHQQLIQRLLEAGEQTLMAAAMLLPGCAPLGWLATGVFAYGLGHALYDGYHAWSLGDREGATEHLFAVASMLAQGMLVQEIHSHLAGRLQLASRADGEVRLWCPSLAPLQPPGIPRGLVAGADGIARQGGRAWAQVQGRWFPVVDATGSEAAVALRLPHNHRGVTPQLQRAGDGWQWAHEQPLNQEGLTLLRGFTELPAEVADLTLLRAQQLAGISDEQLRFARDNGQRPPALLCYWLRRQRAWQALAETGLPVTAAAVEAHLGRLQPLWPASHTLVRSFPALPAELADEIAGQQNEWETEHLRLGTVRRDCRLAAVEALRSLRVGRALEALQRGLPGMDRDRLLLRTLARLPGWPAQVRLRLEQGQPGTLVVEEVGASQMPATGIIAEHGRYRLATQPAATVLTLEAAVLQALAATAPRWAEQGVERLRAVATAHALGHWLRSRADLRLRAPGTPWLRLPQLANGRWGYPLSGRGAAALNPLVARLQRLFPALTVTECENLILHVGPLSGRPMAENVAMMESELAALRLGLRAWVQEVPQGPNAPTVREARLHATRVIEAAWRCESQESNVEGTRYVSLDLSYRIAAELPPLPAPLRQVQALHLSNNALGDGIDEFLRNFPNLRVLTLDGNFLSQIPAPVGELFALRRLSLADLILVPSEHMFAPLQSGVGLQTLRSLDITSAQNVPPAAFAALAAQLPNLDTLRWRNGGTLSGATLTAIGGLRHLRSLDLRYSRLRPGDTAWLASLDELRTLDLSHTDLQMAPAVGGATSLSSLDLRHNRLTAVPEGLVARLEQRPLLLTHIGLRDNRLTRLGPVVPALAQARQAGYALSVDVTDNTLPLDEATALRNAGFEHLYHADLWVGGLYGTLLDAMATARQSSAAAAFLDWVSQHAQANPFHTAGYRTLLMQLFDVDGTLALERNASLGLDDALRALRQRLYAQIQGYMVPTLGAFQRQLDAFRASRFVSHPEGQTVRANRLLQHNYRQWERVLRERYGVAYADEEMHSQPRFVDWLLDHQNDLNQNDVIERIGEQDWRPYLDRLSPRWEAEQALWDDALQTLTEALDSPADTSGLPGELLDAFTDPSTLPRAAGGLGVAAEALPAVSDVVWRRSGRAVPVTLDEGQYLRCVNILRRVRQRAIDRLARAITEPVVGHWWQLAAQGEGGSR